MEKDEKRLIIVGITVPTVVTVVFGIFQVLEYLNVPPSSLYFLTPYLGYTSLILIVVALPVTIVFYLSKRKKPPEKLTFDHLEYWFFYPTKYNWERRERDPARNVPKQKIVLVKDTRKAYIVGKYALDLVLNNESISWFSESEQEDLNSWIVSKGYDPTGEEGTKKKIIDIPFFEAEIKGKKEEYHRGELIRFRTHYRGYLKKGFFDNKIVNVDGIKFVPKRFWRKYDRAWSWPVETLGLNAKWRYWFLSWIPSFQGKLDGYVDATCEWSWESRQTHPWENIASICVCIAVLFLEQ